jgi:hypothetical protein
VIRDVVIHMNNEQPLVADLKTLPTAADACLVCTNIRYLGGKKPSFIDHGDSWFLIPLGIVRFVEIPHDSVLASEEPELLALPATTGELTRVTVPEDDQDDEDDEAMEAEAEAEFLRRIRGS